MHISLIVASSENRVIGGDNQLLWHLPADLKHFKALTSGKPIIMGRKTYASIGKALPGRTNIIMTRDPNFQAQGCIVVASIAQALTAAGEAEEIMVIGGGEIYQATLSLATHIYLTIVHHKFIGDTYFPELPAQEWLLLEKEDHKADDKNAYDYSFLVYTRVSCNPKN